MSPLLDLSPLLSSRLAVWPGDLPFQRAAVCRFEDGSDLDLSELHTTAHAGAHVDAPAHILSGGATLDQLDLEPFLGPCWVAISRPPIDRCVRPEDLDLPEDLPPRLLIRTDSALDPERFTEAFTGLHPDLVPLLQARGVRLVGVDTPSVDPYDAIERPAHHALAQAGIHILEGLVLAHVASGPGFLSALPLRIEGGDGSPVRAVLLR